MTNTDHRRVPRRELSHSAKVATGIGAPVDIRMTDVSMTGARLLVQDSGVVPQQFMILLNDKLSRWCEVIWRADKSVGVRFAAPPASLGKTAPTKVAAETAPAL